VKHRYLSLFVPIFLVLTVTSNAQKVYWAQELVRYSSQFTSDTWCAEEVLGSPNAIQSKDVVQFSWGPRHEESNVGEYIQVRFKKAIHVRQVIVVEAANCGAIYKIFLVDERGKEHKIYHDDKPGPVIDPFRVFTTNVKRPSFKSREVKLVLKTKAVKGHNLIDAIGISATPSNNPIKTDIDVLTYSEPVGKKENLGPRINSQYSERLPIISPDGSTLYFTRKYHPENLGKDNKDDIWMAKRMPGGGWSDPKNVGEPLNDKEHNFVIAVNPSGRNVYLGNDYKQEGRDRDGVSTSSENGETWTKPKTLKIDDMYNDSEFAGYHVSVDERVMLLAVRRDDGRGNRDIYVSFKQGQNKWTKPKNLGPIINTPGMESSVFLAADMKTMYFASSGHNGYGGLDMFVAKRLDNSWTKWSKPKNLGPKINTPGNDFNYTIPAAGDYAYFSSDYNSYGQSDLFKIKLPKEARPDPVQLIKGRLIEVDPIAKGKPEKKIRNDEVHVSIVPIGEKPTLPEVEGFYSVGEEDDSEEEVDYDGTDPEILASNAQLPKDYSDPELDRLKNRLQNLNTDIDGLEKQREKRLEEIQTERVPRTHKSYNSQGTKKSAAPQVSRRPLPEDDELAALRQKYSQNKAPIRVRPSDVKTETPTSNYKRTEFDKKEDPELAAMRRKLGMSNAKPDARKQAEEELAARKSREKVEDVEPVVTSPKPPTEKNEPVEKQTEDSELAALRRKLAGKANENLNSKPNTPNPDDETLAMADPVKEVEEPNDEATTADPEPQEPVKESPVKEVEEPAKLPEPSFDELKEKIRNELEAEMRDDVRNELQKELFDDVKKDLEGNLEDDVRSELKGDLKDDIERKLREDLAKDVQDELKRDLEDDVRKKLSDDLKDDVSNKLRDDLRDDVSNKLRDDLRDDVSNELRDDLKDDIEKELRAALEQKVKDDLKKQLEEQVKEELRNEMEYRIKKELEDKLRRDLNRKLRQQAKERKNDMASTDPNRSKPGSKEPEYVELEQDIELIPVKVGQIIPLRNIFFDANKSVLKEASSAELDRAVEFLTRNKKLIIEVGGHTNGLCSHEFALELSKGRSNAVMNYLVSKGVSRNRIDFKGYGKVVPIASNDSVAGRKKNQRVELKIVEILN